MEKSEHEKYLDFWDAFVEESIRAEEEIISRRREDAPTMEGDDGQEE